MSHSAHVRGAELSDLDAIAAIDTACFASPWTRVVFAEELARSHAQLWVAEAPHVVAFACAWTVADEMHLLRIGVHPQVQRRGVGAALMSAVIGAAQAAGCVQIDLEVGCRNAAARALYERERFIEVGRRVAYYRNPVDDALLLRRRLD